MMTECGVCGKRIVIPYPEFYVYKREGTYFCSLDCMVVFKTQLTRQRCGFKTERTDKEMKQHKLTQEQKKQAVEIAIQGGDFLDYLKKCGAKNPSADWWYIKKTLATKNPQLLEKIPEKIGTVLDENGLAVPAPEKHRELTGALATRKPEKEIEWQHDDPQVVAKVVKKEETAGGLKVTIEKTDELDALLYGAKKLDRALKKDLEYKVIGIETKLGKFQYDHASDQMRWMPRRTTVVIMMPAAEWKKMAEDLPKIMKTIGAEEREDDEDGEE